jgi:hypothetical protein
MPVRVATLMPLGGDAEACRLPQEHRQIMAMMRRRHEKAAEA